MTDAQPSRRALAETHTDTGKVRTGKDANGNVTAHHYDLLDRLDLQELPEDRTLCWVYDGMGNAVEQYGARGSKTQFSYDPLDRLKSTTDAHRSSPSRTRGTMWATSFRSPTGGATPRTTPTTT
jgi:YD repeat-containing protein